MYTTTKVSNIIRGTHIEVEQPEENFTSTKHMFLPILIVGIQ